MHERLEKECDALKEELTSIKATLEERSRVNSSSSLNNEIVDTCLARYEKENESLRATLEEKSGELIKLEETYAKQEEEIVELKATTSALESIQRERDNLKAELTTLKATVECPDDESAAAKLGEDMANLKLEHRVEIKLIKKDHAATKTKCKLLKKELQKIGIKQKDMMTAYENERKSNAELSSSLEDMVAVLEKERAAHSDQVDSLRGKFDALKLKFTRLKKKRVPIDAAYKATRILLDTYEGSAKSTPPKINSKHLKKNRSNDIDEQFSSDSDESITEALVEKQSEIRKLQADLKAAKDRYDELSKSYSDDINAMREELKKEMIQLHQVHRESMQANVESGNKYEIEISKAKEEIALKSKKIESLTAQLDEMKNKLDSAESKIETRLSQEEENSATLEQQLNEEIQLKEASVARVRVLERELKSLTSQLAEKTDEVEVLTQQLIDTKDGLDDLESQLEMHVQKDSETIQDLEDKVEEERQLREEAVKEVDSLNARIHQLKSELQLSEVKLRSVQASHSEEIKQSSGAHDEILEELKHSQTQVEELCVKLENCEEKLALAQREKTEKEEELKNCRDEVERLDSGIADYEKQVAKLFSECSQLKQAAEIADCSQREYEEEARKCSNEVELLNKQMAAAEVKSKQALKQEVDRLKAEFNEVIAAFEKGKCFPSSKSASYTITNVSLLLFYRVG